MYQPFADIVLIPESRSPGSAVTTTEPILLWVGVRVRGTARRGVIRKTWVRDVAVDIVATGGAGVEPDPGMASDGVASHLIGAALATQAGVVHVGATVRALVENPSLLPEEQTVSVLAAVGLVNLTAVVPDGGIARELVDPEEICSAIAFTMSVLDPEWDDVLGLLTVNIGKPEVGAIKTLSRLDLSSIVPFVLLVPKPGRGTAVRFHADVIHTARSRNVSEVGAVVPVEEAPTLIAFCAVRNHLRLPVKVGAVPLAVPDFQSTSITIGDGDDIRLAVPVPVSDMQATAVDASVKS